MRDTVKRTWWMMLVPLAVLAVACQPVEEAPPPPTTAAAPTTQWQCRNDVEISCGAVQCEAAEDFTPMDVTVDDAGTMTVCAYSGCWEGTGTVTRSEQFVVLTGHELPFSSNPEGTDNGQDIAIVIDQNDDVALLKAGSFAHPLRCERSTP